MYYVVNLIHQDYFTIVPENWIKDLATHKEHFFNNGIKSNQVYVCYWTDSSAARGSNDEIKLDFTPDFSLGFDFEFPAEGVYLCKIMKAKANFDEACKYGDHYLTRRRPRRRQTRPKPERKSLPKQDRRKQFLSLDISSIRLPEATGISYLTK